MEFKQKTISDFIESERLMVLTASERFGPYFDHALDASLLLSSFVTSTGTDREIFVRFLSQIKKHHTLAVFSTVRLHQIQALMNLRQVLEAGTCAAFAIANADISGFADTTESGLLDQSETLTKKRYKWLEQYYPVASAYIKDQKEKINKSVAHANISYTNNNFHFSETRPEANTLFFDIEDKYFVNADLLREADIAISLIDILFGVNKTAKVVVFLDDFMPRFSNLRQQNDALVAEMKSTDRFRQAEQKFGANCKA